MKSQEQQLDELVKNLEIQYPGLLLSAYYNFYNVHIQQIELPKEMQGKGIGTKVIEAIQNHAKSIPLPVTLFPQAQPRKKKRLIKFYKNLGFYPNKGRKRDYRFASVWIWRP